MDTISRENNSMLPVGGIIVGVLGLLIAGYAAISLSSVKKTLAEQQTKIENVETAATSAAKDASQAAQAASKTGNDLRGFGASVQDTVNKINDILGDHAGRLTKIEESAKKAPVGAAKKGGEHVTAGPGEYIVKPGDVSGAKIARDHGVSLADLQAVNPGVDWTKLKLGQKLKLPSSAKK